MKTDFQIVHYERNPRAITEQRFVKLQHNMQKFGDLSGIVINIRADENGKDVGELVGGNQRSEAGAFINSKPVIENEYDPPLPDGTVADGYFEYQGRRFSARFVRWDADMVEEANLIANISSGIWDWNQLANIPVDVLDNAGLNLEFLREQNQNAQSLLGLINSESPPLDPLELWRGMPEFEHSDLTAFQSIHIHFSSQDDVNKFAELIGQKIGEKTRSIWYPEVQKINMTDYYDRKS